VRPTCTNVRFNLDKSIGKIHYSGSEISGQTMMMYMTPMGRKTLTGWPNKERNSYYTLFSKMVDMVIHGSNASLKCIGQLPKMEKNM